MLSPLHHRQFIFLALAWIALAFCLTGCKGMLRGVDQSALYGAPAGPVDNPLFLPPLDPEFVWSQLVDSLDDHFRIEREERVRLIGGILTEGRIDTFPQIGSTLLEPWRGDSTPGYEKLHATLQSIRRKATLRLIPTEGGSLVDLVVQKELEDLDKPEHATAGGATMRYDGTLVRREGLPGRYSVSLGWIPIGRDCSLEQKLLADIRARLNVPAIGPGNAGAVISQGELPAGSLPIESIPPGNVRPSGEPPPIPAWQPRSPESLPAPSGPPAGNILLPSRLQ
ncbi:hypothetical protein ETAA8_19380 [Anatilimnocola aggregata]|uniref:Uncharacterized protein n=1 Tax=Anatilimnocola aggregata TaxID=2528021 RepID=A0A517Y9E7_9BACT|nr:hypothetical protein [Anatilimnocola aggregata]QDU26854.1 hypothetical protein ETAA8_19380 [Anatilimnocola aggregata]